MYRGEAGSCLLLSVLPRHRLVSGVPAGWGGMAGGGADPRVLRWLPVRGEPPADPLTPFARNSSPAARASLERYRRPSEEGSPPCPLVSPTLEGWCWCPNSPWGHPRWHPCIHHAGTHARAAPAAHGGTPVTSPWHTRVAAPLAPATDRHGPAVCGTPGSSPQPGAGMGGGGRGRRATLPTHGPHGAPSPTLARPSPEPPPPGRGWGGDKDTVPLHTPPRPR